MAFEFGLLVYGNNLFVQFIGGSWIKLKPKVIVAAAKREKVE